MRGGTDMAPKQGQNQGDVIRSFTLGNKELEGKTAEFQYDRGQYTITDVVGEERNIVYKSRNAQEAYTKWNVYIGRKKERPERSERQTENASGSDRQARGKGSAREESRTERSGRRAERGDSRTERAGRRREREETRAEHTGNIREHAESRTEQNGKRQERGKRSRRNSETVNEGNGGYHQGFTASQGAEDTAVEKGARRPRHRRNNHKGQEN
jgi:hypothetical protein